MLLIKIWRKTWQEDGALIPQMWFLCRCGIFTKFIQIFSAEWQWAFSLLLHFTIANFRVLFSRWRQKSLSESLKINKQSETLKNVHWSWRCLFSSGLFFCGAFLSILSIRGFTPMKSLNKYFPRRRSQLSAVFILLDSKRTQESQAVYLYLGAINLFNKMSIIIKCDSELVTATENFHRRAHKLIYEQISS